MGENPTPAIRIVSLIGLAGNLGNRGPGQAESCRASCRDLGRAEITWRTRLPDESGARNA